MGIRVDSPHVLAANGKLALRGILSRCQPYALGISDLDANTLPFTVNAAGTPTPVCHWYWKLLERRYNSPLIGTHITFEDSTDTTAAADFSVRLSDDSAQRWYMNSPIHVRCMAGNSQTPFMLYDPNASFGLRGEPLIIPPANKVSIYTRKVTGSATTMRICLHGRNYYAATPDPSRVARWLARRRFVYPYWLGICDGSLGYDVGGVSVTAGATKQVNVNIEDGHFEGLKLMAVSTYNFYCEIVEMRSLTTLWNGRISQTNGIGNANYPCVFDVPFMLPKGAQLRVTLQNANGSYTNKIFLCMFGRNIIAPWGDQQEVDSKGVSIDEFED